MATNQGSSFGSRVKGLLHRRKSRPSQSGEDIMKFRQSRYEDSTPGTEPAIGAVPLKGTGRAASSQQSRPRSRARSSASRPTSQLPSNVAVRSTSIDAGSNRGFWQPSNSPTVPLRRPQTFAKSTQETELVKDLSRASISDQARPISDNTHRVAPGSSTIRKVPDQDYQDAQIRDRNSMDQRNFEQHTRGVGVSTSLSRQDYPSEKYSPRQGHSLPQDYSPRQNRSQPQDYPPHPDQPQSRTESNITAAEVVRRAQTNSVDTTVDERTAPAVTHETVTKKVHHVREEIITKDIHHYDVFHRIQPVIDVELLPARHYVPTADGTLKEVSIDELPGRYANEPISNTFLRAASDTFQGR